MNLILDLGNSYTKAALFRRGEISHLSSFKTCEEITDKIKKLTEQQSVKKVILSSVSSEFIELDNFLSENFDFYLKLNHKTKVPIKNFYETPETLGKDRLAAVIAASNIFPNTDVLVFDAGTALTIDFINQNNEYLGGSISPGINMRYEALHYFTKKLPKLTIDENIDSLTGKNTNESIITGVQNGILNEVEKYIEKYLIKYPELKVVFTGGDTYFFEKRIKNKIFTDPNIVLKGLNIILEYNAT
ncbi:MAG: type III pantothenate kinase [Bacteroidales bacterium]|nr:type III pantothenate kinase [Bacteroidales bacterium]